MAVRQDAATVRAILDYRAAVAARDAWQDRERGMQAFEQQPRLLEVLRRLYAAQGTPLPEPPGEGEGAACDLDR